MYCACARTTCVHARMLNGHGPFQFWICRINFYTKNGDVGGYVQPVNKSFLSFWGLTSEVNGRLEGSKLTAGSLVRPLCRVGCCFCQWACKKLFLQGCALVRPLGKKRAAALLSSPLVAHPSRRHKSSCPHQTSSILPPKFCLRNASHTLRRIKHCCYKGGEPNNFWSATYCTPYKTKFQRQKTKPNERAHPYIK